jgi:DHA1 family bicyclomycin/chloramphenicol resistance-like MFS transporter
MSATLVGLALGQLVVGPLSDRTGRRPPVLVGMALFVVVTALCAAAPDIETLLVLRFLQGLTGAAGLVLARAAVRDLYSGSAAARVFSRLMLVMGLAPVIGPVLGGQVLRFTGWRGLFVALALIGLLILVASWLLLEETHHPDNRHDGTIGEQVHEIGRLLRDRHFLGYASISALLGATLFTYISMSSFVLRDHYGVSPQAFSAVFATNAVGLVVGSQLNAAIVGRFGPARNLAVGLGICTAAAAGLLVTSAAGAPLGWVLVPLFVVVTSLGGMMANTVALALTPYGHVAGGASAVLGSSQFLVGALVPPVVFALSTAAWVMGATMVVTSGLALALLLQQRPFRRPEHAASAAVAAVSASGA